MNNAAPADNSKDTFDTATSSSHKQNQPLDAQQIGNYRLLKEIGRGGMAIVYEAFQISLNRSVAIKIITSDLSEEPEYLERFKREAQAAANLSHANIVSVHEFGQWDNKYYYVMDLIHGKTIDALILEKKHELLKSAQRFTSDETLDIIEQAAQALSYAHKSGVIHRDIKPSNILIDQNTKRVLIADFGLARSTRWEKITPRASLFGTPAYMSPEQAEGKPVDHRTDIYSLGALFFEMLTGNSPYPGNNALDVINKVKTLPITPPRKINPNIPLPVQSIILRAMSKDIRYRYPEMESFLVDIKNYRSGQKISTYKEIAVKQISKKKKFYSTIIYILLSLAAIAGISIWWLYLRERTSAMDIKQQLELARNYELAGMKGKAVEIYTEIIEQYQGTEYSQMARVKIDKM